MKSEKKKAKKKPGSAARARKPTVEDEPKFHIPMGILCSMDGKSQLRYVTRLEVDPVELMQEQIATILDSHAQNWMTTEFSGDVYLKCWNEMLEGEHLETASELLRRIVAWAQNVVDANSMTTADGNRVVLRCSLSASPVEDFD